MSDTAEDLQEGSALGSLRARIGRGGGVGGGELPRIETREEEGVEEDSLENISSVCARLTELLLEDQLACDVQVSFALESSLKFEVGCLLLAESVCGRLLQLQAGLHTEAFPPHVHGGGGERRRVSSGCCKGASKPDGSSSRTAGGQGDTGHEGVEVGGVGAEWQPSTLAPEDIVPDRGTGCPCTCRHSQSSVTISCVGCHHHLLQQVAGGYQGKENLLGLPWEQAGQFLQHFELWTAAAQD